VNSRPFVASNEMWRGCILSQKGWTLQGIPLWFCRSLSKPFARLLLLVASIFH
jgi:hypothetical protein